MIGRAIGDTGTAMPGPIVVSAFYLFVPLPDHEAMRDRVLDACTDQGMRGSILLASEGINGTVAGTRSATDAFFAWLRRDPRLASITTKESFADAVPFLRMKVRRKQEIVSFRQSVDPTKIVGTYIAPERWNEVVADPDVLLIDTRNVEEIELGTFANAVNPQTESFTEFAGFVQSLDPDEHPRVAMFCTGGIRCEKASAYMLEQGFGEVLHLEGGILNYLEQVEPSESLWQGECFVFDERVSVDHDLAPGQHSLCRGCRRPVSPEGRLADGYEEGVSCSECVDELTPQRRLRLLERHRQVMLAEARGEQHIARDG